MARIVFFETEKWEEEFFTQHFPSEEVHFSPHTLASEHEYEPSLFDAELISVFAFSQVTKEVLEKFPNLKYLTTRSTGVDHIDLAYCKERGIIVSNVPAYGVHSVAEHAIGLMIALSRKLITSIERTRKGDFTLEGLRGFELAGKTLGVVGTGNIGKVVIQIALGMGMNVIAYNRHADDDMVKLGVTYTDLDSLFGQSDVITLHLPYMKETHHIINMENITKIKKGALLINAARGGLVETQAILEGLKTGILSGAGLDVLEEEGNIREERELLSTKLTEMTDVKTQLLDHMLLNREDVIITPHNAFNSNEAVHQILDTTVTNIQQYLANTPQNVVS
jgi:D-lactate dehydrogenase